MQNESVFLPVREDGSIVKYGDVLRAFLPGEFEHLVTAATPFDMVEYVPLKTAYWLVVQTKNPTSVTVHRCSNPECRLTTYAHRLPPYCQECGSKMLGKAREEDDKYIVLTS